MSLEAYKIAVRISLVENVTRGLALMARHFKTTDAEAAALEARLKSIAKTAAIGGVMIGAGLGGLALLKGPIEEAKKYQIEIAKISALGLGDGVTQHADKFAQGAKIIGNSARDMAHAYGDALAIFKNTREADLVTPVIAKMKFANQALYGEGGASRDASLYSLMKTIEFRGGTRNAAEFAIQADMAQKVVNASRGRVDGAQMLQAMKSGGILTKMLSNKAFYLDSEPFIQEMGGFRYGTGINAINSNLFQGRGSVLSQQELYRLGLLDRSKVQFNKFGMLKRALPGAFDQGMNAMIAGGPLGLLNDVLLPAFARAGITDPKAIQNELGMILSNSRGAALMGTAYQQHIKIAMQAAINGKARGVNASVGVAARTATGRENDLLAKEASLKLKIGLIILPYYVRGLEMAAAALDRLNAFATSYPLLTKILVGGFALVSVLAVVGGSLTMVVAGFRGLMLLRFLVPVFRLIMTYSRLFVGALAYLPQVFRVVVAAMGPVGLAIAAIAAVAWLVYNNWTEIKAALGVIWTDIKTAIAQLFSGDILGALKSFGHAIALAFQTIFNTIIAGLNHILPEAWQISKFNFAGDPTGASPNVRTGAGQPVQVHTTVNMDGRKVAAIVSGHQAKSAGRANTGSTGFDSSRSMPMVAMSAMK